MREKKYHLYLTADEQSKVMLPIKFNPALMKSLTMSFMPLIKQVEKVSEKPNGIFNLPKTASSVLSNSELSSH